MSLIKKAYDLWQEYGIGVFFLFCRDMVLWHSITASLSGRQCSVYISVIPIISDIILQMLSKMSLSHFIEEQDGRSEAKASIGRNFSILLEGARSMRVMAPSFALTSL